MPTAAVGHHLDVIERLATTPGNDFCLGVQAAPADGFVPAEALPFQALPKGLPPRVGATWALEAHAWWLGAAVLGAHLLTGRIPPLRAIEVRIGAVSGTVEALALPAGGWREVTPAQLATQLAAHVAPLVCALSEHRPVNPLWRSASDRVAQAALWCADAFGTEAIELATAVLAAPTPLHAPARFNASGDRRRVGCCLTYLLPDQPRCANCCIAPKLDG